MTAQQTLALDFGTSNSAAAISVGGEARIVPLDGQSQTIPTAVFFDFDTRRAVYGQAANQALFDGEWGRYMRALKSVLGTPLCRERRSLIGQRMTFIDIIGRFLGEAKARAEAATGQTFTHAVSGRPVRFHSEDAARDAQALDDLRASYAAAGFEDVRFVPEPEAAARANAHVLAPGDLGLVVDIGGGTSDYTLFRAGRSGIDILGSYGIRLGGTDIDRTLSLDHAMPLLGRGSAIRHAFGDATHLAPNALYSDLATWAKIPFLYTAETRSKVADLVRHAADPARMTRLARVLEDELGHDLAFAVEAAKIAANGDGPEDARRAEIDLAVIEKGLSVSLDGAGLDASVTGAAERITTAAQAACAQFDTDPEAVTHLILVGGSSLLRAVEAGLAQAFPRAARHRGAALTAIIEGLGLAAGEG